MSYSGVSYAIARRFCYTHRYCSGLRSPLCLHLTRLSNCYYSELIGINLELEKIRPKPNRSPDVLHGCFSFLYLYPGRLKRAARIAAGCWPLRANRKSRAREIGARHVGGAVPRRGGGSRQERRRGSSLHSLPSYPLLMPSPHWLLVS